MCFSFASPADEGRAAPPLPDAGAARPSASRGHVAETPSRPVGRAPPDAPRSLPPHRQRRSGPTSPAPCTCDQHRHPFARVVGAAPGRVVAVVGGEDRQIAGPQAAQETRPRAHRTIPARGHSPTRRGGGHKGCRTRRSSQRSRNRARRRPQGASDVRKGQHRDLPLCSVPMPCIEKMSPILPTAWVARPAPCTQSSRVGAGGRDGIVMPVRGALETAAACPTKGRAITRPTFIACSVGASACAQLQQPVQPEAPLHARRSGTRYRPRCSRSASRSA